MKHPIPTDALDDRLGFLGTSGSGKTYNAGTAIEILLARHARVVIVDPLGVWYGLRLLEDGKTPSGFNVVIFGGDHADLPLNEQAGALIGETAASMAESCIIDLSKMPSRSAERRFMAAFLETIYRKAGGEPFHLVVDEADLFAPQKPQAGDEALLGHMENIVRRGRVRGFIPWLISQRPAVLNKNVLSQVDGLLAFRLTSSQDREALDAWIEGQADKAQGKEIKDALPTFQIGEGLVWLPSHGILARKQFPPKITFDSSCKPKRGEKLKSRKLQPIDVGKLKDQIAAVVEEAKANDPKELRKRIAELEAAAKKAPATDAAAIEAAEQRGFEQARKQLTAEMEREVQKRTTEFAEGLSIHLDALTGYLEENGKAVKARPTLSIEYAAPPRPVLAALVRSPAPARPRPPAGADCGNGGALPGPQQRILNSLATWKQIGEPAPSNAQVAWLAGYSPSSSSYKNPRSALNTSGLLTYPSGDLVAITAEGEAAALPIELTGSLLEFVLSNLPGPEARILKSIASHYPNAVDNATAAQGADYSPTSSSYKNPRSAIRTKDLITYPSGDQVRAADWLFAA